MHYATRKLRGGAFFLYFDPVCGFEAFINGKHIVGEVKEKEQAHKEYREAISKGHGAYLMDEETPVRWSVREPEDIISLPSL